MRDVVLDLNRVAPTDCERGGIRRRTWIRGLCRDGLTALPGRNSPTSIWMYQGGSHLLYPVSGGRAPEAAGRRGGGST